MKKKIKITILAILGIMVIIFAPSLNIIEFKISGKENFNLKTANSWNLTGSPILIDDSDPMRNWAYTESNFDWCSGAGTVGNPYVIENVTIDGQFSGSCIEIRNSNAHFVIRNCTLYHSWFDWFFDPYAGIRLDYVTNGIIVNNNCSFNVFHGISLFYSDHNTISGNILNRNYNGLFVAWSANNDITGNIIENNIEYGIYLDWAESNTLSGNNMTNCGIGVEGGESFIKTNNIDTSNLVSQKPVYYYTDTVGLIPSDFTNAGQVILVNCDNSMIGNINTSRGSCGIALHYCEGNVISYVNSSYNNDRGIYLSGSIGNIIVYNNVHHNGHGTQYNIRGGIVLLGSSLTNISYNFFNYNSIGIHMQNGENITLHNNTANYNTECGVELGGLNLRMYFNRMKECGIKVIGEYVSTYTIHISNEVNEKPVYFYNGINNLLPTDFNNAGQVILSQCNNSLISNLNVSHGSCGISLFNSHYNVISFNNASYNTIYGFYLDWLSSNNNISENMFINNLDRGVYIGGHSNLITRNIVNWNKLNLDSYAGILLYGDNNTINSNEIKRNNRYGILLMGNNNTISENQISKNYLMGIDFNGDKNNVIKNNISDNRETGIRVRYSKNNIFTGNHIENNTLYGINVRDDNCEDNYFFNNIFIQNGIQVSDNSTPGTNFWDNGTVGNYWDDYMGFDANDDGIGDEPYNITGSAGSQDNFPIWDDGYDLDVLPPNITILEPNPYQLFGTNAPDFMVEITDENLHIMWYTIDNSLNNFSFTSNDTINQSAWNLKLNGTVLIIFYANDTFGHTSSEELTVRKDIEAPQIQILVPSMNEIFQVAPAYEVSVVEGNLDMIWYTLNDAEKYFIDSEFLGIINQGLWDALPNGYITIKFYANDSLGNLNFDEVIVVKDTLTPPGNGGIPGYNLFVLLGIISLTALIIIKFRHKK